jgi:mono/diheme cytochrome c family protein
VVGRYTNWVCGWIALLMAGCATVHAPAQTRTTVDYSGPVGSRDIARGGSIFSTFCNPCHAGRVNPRGYEWSPAEMRRQIREGNAAMPGISEEYLSRHDLEAVLAFLTVVSAVDAELPPEPTAASPDTWAGQLAQPLVTAP